MALRLAWLAGVCVVIGLVGAGISSAGDAGAAGAPVTAAFERVGGEALHNGHRVTEKVISGAQPEGDESFEALRALGVKTIISVDGAKPDLERARKFGMRYVHLPIGYDGVTPDQGKAIAKAIDELPGPIYVHCHHGRHRSAAAVAVACVYNGMLPPEKSEAVLKAFGTGANYKGLWKSALDARAMDLAALRATPVEYVEAATLSDLAESMVAVDRHNEHLKLIQKAGWQTPKDHPDLAPAHEALQLAEHFHELGRTGQAADYPEDFRQMLTASEGAAQDLRSALSAKPPEGAKADTAFKSLATSCTDCHKAHRD